MAEDYSKIYLFLGQQGTNWHNVADSNRDGVVIKTEWTGYVNDNWDENTLGQKSADLISSFFDNVLNSTKGYAKAGSTNYNQSSAVDSNEAGKIAATVAVYSLQNEIKTQFGLNSVPAGIFNEMMQNIANHIQSMGITGSEQIMQAIQDNSTEWVYGFVNSRILDAKLESIIRPILNAAGLNNVTGENASIKSLWEQSLSSITIPTDSVLTEQELSGLTSGSNSFKTQVTALIQGNLHPENDSTCFVYDSELHRPQMEKAIRDLVNSRYTQYSNYPEKFEPKITEFLNDLENGDCQIYPTLTIVIQQQIPSKADSYFKKLDNILTVMNAFDTLSNITRTIGGQTVTFNTKAEVKNELIVKLGAANDDKKKAMIDKILGTDFQDFNDKIMEELYNELENNYDNYHNTNSTQLKPELIAEFVANAIIKHLDDFIKFDSTTELSEMGEKFNFAFGAMGSQSAPTNSLEVLKNIAKDLCGALVEKGYQSQVASAFGSDYNAGIDSIEGRTELNTKIEDLLKACKNGTSNTNLSSALQIGDGDFTFNHKIPGGGSGTTHPTTASSMASDNTTSISFTNSDDKSENVTIASLLEYAGKSKDIIAMHTGTNITSGKTYIMNKITAIGNAMKASAYGYNNASAIDSACSKAKSVYERLYAQFIKTTNNKNTEVLASNNNDVNYSTTEGEHCFSCKTWKHEGWDKNFLKNKKAAMQTKCQQTTAGLLVVQNGNRCSNNFAIYTFLDMGRVVEMISKFLDA